MRPTLTGLATAIAAVALVFGIGAAGVAVVTAAPAAAPGTFAASPDCSGEGPNCGVSALADASATTVSPDSGEGPNR